MQKSRNNLSHKKRKNKRKTLKMKGGDINMLIHNSIEYFWKESFHRAYTNINPMTIMEKIKSIVNNDEHVCEILRNAKIKIPRNKKIMFLLQQFSSKTNPEFEHHYCKIFIIISILSKILENNCDIILKGGKSLQLMLPVDCFANTDDLDYLVISKTYGLTNADIAQHIAYFILWATKKNNQMQYEYLIKGDPSNIVKISYKHQNRYIPITDIGFTDYNIVNPNILLLYSPNNNMDSRIIEYTNGDTRHKIQGNITSQIFKAIITEKLYYISYYTQKRLLTNENKISDLSLYFINKTIKQLKTILQCFVDTIKELEPEEASELLQSYGYDDLDTIENSYSGILTTKSYENLKELSEDLKIKFCLLQEFYNKYESIWETLFNGKRPDILYNNIKIINHILDYEKISELEEQNINRFVSNTPPPSRTPQSQQIPPPPPQMPYPTQFQQLPPPPPFSRENYTMMNPYEQTHVLPQNQQLFEEYDMMLPPSLESQMYQQGPIMYIDNSFSDEMLPGRNRRRQNNHNRSAKLHNRKYK